ncbi:hypothetical protein BHE74_00044318 [Ensete ventricosum]|nr:hypothetical protein BHE74_00044318 [Ensete ventricosum]
MIESYEALSISIRVAILSVLTMISQSLPLPSAIAAAICTNVAIIIVFIIFHPLPLPSPFFSSTVAIFTLPTLLPQHYHAQQRCHCCLPTMPSSVQPLPNVVVVPSLPSPFSPSIATIFTLPTLLPQRCHAQQRCCCYLLATPSYQQPLPNVAIVPSLPSPTSNIATPRQTLFLPYHNSHSLQTPPLQLLSWRDLAAVALSHLNNRSERRTTHLPPLPSFSSIAASLVLSRVTAPLSLLPFIPLSLPSLLSPSSSHITRCCHCRVNTNSVAAPCHLPLLFVSSPASSYATVDRLVIPMQIILLRPSPTTSTSQAHAPDSTIEKRTEHY